MKALALIKRFLALEGIYGPEPGCGFSMFSTPFFSPGGGSSGSRYSIANSVRLRASASAYFSRTPGSAGDRKKWTYSGWVKRGAFGSVRFPLMDMGTASSDTTTFEMGFWNTGTNDTFFIGGGVTNWRVSNALYRDPTAHYHVVVAIDTANATADDRIKVWINGSRITSWATNNAIGSSADTAVNQSGVAHYIGRRDGGSDYADGVLSDVHFIDGQALSASDFGETNADGVWVPKSYTGTYGTNGFKLDFKDAAVTSGSNAGLGKDVSGNGNYWNTNNISVTAGATYDALTDTPTNNYCTLNPLVPATYPATLSNGNIKYSRSASGTGYTNSYGTLAITNALAYFEVTPASGGVSNNGVFGVAATLANTATCLGWASDQWGWEWYMAKKVSNATETAYGTAAASGDVLRCAVNTLNGKIWFGNASGWFGSGDPAGGTNETFSGLPSTVFPAVSGYTGLAEFDINFGQRPFAYTPPTGFKSLCTANLPSVAITNPALHAKVVKRTSVGGTYTNSALAFQPDLALIKAYSNTDNYYLQDVVRGFGASKSVSTNQTGAEGANGSSPGTHSFTPASDGYSLSGVDFNTSGYSYVDLLLKLGGTAVSASGGSGYSAATISANATAGISVIKLTTNVAAGGSWSVNHGLSGAPDMVIFKQTNNANNWPTYLKDAHASPLDNYWILNGGASNTGSTGIFNVSGTVVGSSNSFVNSGDTVLIICIKSIPGFSKVGVYTGNGSPDGPCIHTGFSPEFLLGRTTTTPSNWLHMDGQRDGHNAWKSSMYFDDSAYEATGTVRLDALSNGFKVRDSNAVLNNSNTVFYWAMARHPFGGSNVSPAPAR